VSEGWREHHAHRQALAVAGLDQGMALLARRPNPTARDGWASLVYCRDRRITGVMSVCFQERSVKAADGIARFGSFVACPRNSPKLLYYWECMNCGKRVDSGVWASEGAYLDDVLIPHEMSKERRWVNSDPAMPEIVLCISLRHVFVQPN
jgi:hypothetical protein